MGFAPLPPPLPAETLALRETLPVKMTPVTLAGQFVRLEPFDSTRHPALLFPLANGSPATLAARPIEAYDADELIWRYMGGGPFATLAEFVRYCEGQQQAADGLCLCVIDQPSDAPIGMVNFMNNVPGHLKVELGGIWYSPLAQRTKANTEATFLMLRHAFQLGYQRVEWKCHVLNTRSRRAALRMGFQFEGIQEAHMIMKGRRRDTAWFRILVDEWPSVATHLQTLLDG
ncbi:MAG TPA: GNAT family protein [Caldilineaceae bacterium]|nr:GNAT family protein [Caldilineaceae bacterium]